MTSDKTPYETGESSQVERVRKPIWSRTPGSRRVLLKGQLEYTIRPALSMGSKSVNVARAKASNAQDDLMQISVFPTHASQSYQ